MKKLGWLFFAISLIINGALVWFFVYRGEVIEVKDERRAVMLTSNNRNIVLGEMRKFLSNVQQIQEGILENNPEKIIKAAESSGRGIEEKVPQGLIKSIPLDFKQMGFRTHDIFDEIADSVRVKYNPVTTQTQINEALNLCVSCHHVYQIKVKKE